MKTTRVILLNLFIYFLSFIVVMFAVKGRFYSVEITFRLLAYYFTAWLFSSLLARKFKKPQKQLGYFTVARPYFISLLLFMGILSLVVNIIMEESYSRLVLYGSPLLAFVIENILVFAGRKRNNEAAVDISLHVSVPNIVIETTLLTWIIFCYIFYHSIGFNNLSLELVIPTVGMYLGWFIGIALTHKFEILNYKANFWNFSSRYLKSYVIIAALTVFGVFIFNIEPLVQKYYLTAILLYVFWSFTILLMRYIYKKPVRTDEVKTKLVRATSYPEMDKIEEDLLAGQKYKVNTQEVFPGILREKLRTIYLSKFPEVFEFISRNLDLESVDYLKANVIRSSDVYNVEVMPDNSLTLFCNLHEMNDIRRINAYYIEVNKKLIDRGVFIGKFEPIRFRYKRFLENYPNIIAQLFYFVDFLWRRISPKLPVIQKFYFAVTKGRNRAISFAEGLGRLYYCGFKIIDIQDIDNFIYFIAAKVDQPSEDLNPSYGPLIKLKRVGKEGKIINVYKIRTMHPYSEYIQEFTYSILGTETGDKISEDFRVTNWGRIIRKFWIDELPMLINLIKGDLKIVGVRPLSQHKFNIYPIELQKQRVRYKPGLIPPYYAILPKNQQEFYEAEKSYLVQYERRPIYTDIKFFFKAWYNIIIKKARSA